MKKAAIVAAGLIAGGGFATTAAPGNQFVQTILVARVESSGVLGYQRSRGVYGNLIERSLKPREPHAVLLRVQVARRWVRNMVEDRTAHPRCTALDRAWTMRMRRHACSPRDLCDPQRLGL